VIAIARSDLAIELGVAAAAATALWFALVGLLVVATRAKEPEPVPAGLELGGDESPAVVNLITRGWKVRGEALTATLVDLAARHALTFADDGHGSFSVAIEKRDVPTSDYERRVLDLVSGLASNGPVPAAALTSGTEAQARSFHKGFSKEVIADARRRGLSRPRWSKTMTALVSAVAVGPALLAAGAMVALPDSHSSTSSSSSDNPIGAFIGIAILVWGALIAFFGWLRAERDTPSGLACAGRWLGLQHNLEADGTFPDLPPTAVSIWDRYLAFAVALGVAATTERTFPIGAESDTEAWSSAGGRWRLVRIRYPRRLPPGWGRPPWHVALVGLFGTVVATGFAAYVLPALYDVQGDVLRDATAGDRRAALGVGVGILVLAVVAAVVAARSLWMLVLGVSDIGRARTIEGQVLRVRTRNERPYIAIDDGASDHIRAWVNASSSTATQGERVRAVIAAHVGYVRKLDSIGGA